MHASKYFAHFPLNFISSVSASEIAGWLSFPDARGVCSHCSRFWQHHWFLCASCTDPDRAHNLLRSSYHAWHHARRVEKDGKARGVLRTTQVFFCFFFLVMLFCLNECQKSNISWWQTKLQTYACSVFVAEVEANYHAWFCFSLFGHDNMQDWCCW